MQPDITLDPPQQRPTHNWSSAIGSLAVAWAGLFALTFAEWRDMAHQWWNIDTYSHILLIPLIVGWLVWLRRNELAKVEPQGWIPGLLVVGAGLSVWVAGHALDINLFSQVGTVLAFQGAVLAVLGLRVGMILAFPIAYSALLVPFGDEIIPQLQAITAKLATVLTEWSGVATVADDIYIDTPAGLFIVAEACSGVKFLIAMVALGILVAHTCFSSWKRRAWFMLACVIVPILANGVRAWATIYIAQYVGAEAAGGFDHIVYGWFFFGIVIAMVLGVSWRWFERDPEDAGMTAQDVSASPLIARFEGKLVSPLVALGAVLFVAVGFAVMARLV